MRYIVQFRDKTTKRISEEEAKPLMLALAKGKPAILRGAFINPYFIDCIKPVSKEWFDQDYVRLELENGDRLTNKTPLPSPS